VYEQNCDQQNIAHRKRARPTRHQQQQNPGTQGRTGAKGTAKPSGCWGKAHSGHERRIGREGENSAVERR